MALSPSLQHLRLMMAGESFRRQIERLEEAFEIATGPFRSELNRIERESAEHEALVDAGEATWVEGTDDGFQHDYGDDFSERREDALDALSSVRSAFTYLIYHQWERMAQRLGDSGSRPDHKKLVKVIKGAGLPLDEEGLETAKLLVNTLKHNSAECGPLLFQRRADLFRSNFDPQERSTFSGKPKRIQWADGIQLTDEHIRELFAVVRRSAPKAKPLPKD